MSVYSETSAYLDGLFALSRSGFRSPQDATTAIFQLVREQLGMRSSFLSRASSETNRFHIVAAHNEPGGCGIEIGSAGLLAQSVALAGTGGESCHLSLEDVSHAGRFSADETVLAMQQIGCYLGVPVVLSDGSIFGTLGSADPAPRQINPAQTKLLGIAAHLLATHIEREQEMTERKRLQGELSAVLASLEQTIAQQSYMEKIQNDFVAIVNHEFRTALTGIQGFSELMRKEAFSYEEIKEFADEINADARRLSHLVNQLLELGQMKSGAIALQLEVLDLNIIIQAVIDEIRPTTPDHHILLRRDRLILPVQGDREKLTHVVSNLLNNAVKYAPDGGEILVNSSIEGESAHVSVRDQGVGIPADALERVFDPYYSRVQSETTRYIKGTGLGLPIVRQVLQLHGGNVWVESVLGQGSTFHFTLPLSTSSTTMEDSNG